MMQPFFYARWKLQMTIQERITMVKDQKQIYISAHNDRSTQDPSHDYIQNSIPKGDQIDVLEELLINQRSNTVSGSDSVSEDRFSACLKRNRKEDEESMLNILIVEDNYNERKHAMEIIEQCFSGIELYEAENVHDALKQLMNHDMDLLLLDINLPDGTGFDVAKDIRGISQYRFIHIVFITGEGYDPLETYNTYHCYSFITKPYFRDTMIEQLTPVIEALKKEKKEGRAQVRRKVRIFNTTVGELILPVDDILYIEIQLRNMIIHTETEIYTVKRMSIKAFMEYIDDPDFFRCHESCVVNMRKVIMIGATGHRDSVAVFDNGDKGCTVSQRRCREMKELLDKEAIRRDSGRDR